MIWTIFFFNIISSAATPANPPTLALWASWLMLLASPANWRRTSASALRIRCTTFPVSNTECTNLLRETPASFLRFSISLYSIAGNHSQTTRTLLRLVCHDCWLSFSILKFVLDCNQREQVVFPFRQSMGGNVYISITLLPSDCPCSRPSALFFYSS